MPNIQNFTPFEAGEFRLIDQHAQPFIVVVLKAAFKVEDGAVQVADEQLPVFGADEYFGDPALSSIRFESDLAWSKPSFDLMLNGSAFAPAGEPKEAVMVRLEVGQLRKDLQVSGDRFWRRTAAGVVASTPRRFETMPVIYERAFGGTKQPKKDGGKIVMDRRNPVGIGYRNAKAVTDEVESELPNVEHPKMLVSTPGDSPVPVGFGAIGRSWGQRAQFAGTYDSDWLEEQCPLLPFDFDERYHQAAPPDQQVPELRPGTQVRVYNMSPGRRWEFAVPRLDVPVRLLFSKWDEELVLRTDTLLLEPSINRLVLTARAKAALPRRHGPLDEIVFGKVKRGWWRSYVRGKEYLDQRGEGAVAAGTSHFRR